MRALKTLLVLAAVAQLTGVTQLAAAETVGGVAYIRSRSETLPGYYYKPEGKGPFPAVVFVRAASRPVSEATPPFPELAKNFTSRGYVVIMPCWQLPAEMAAERARDPLKKNTRMSLPEFQGMARQVAAAVAWGKAQSFVDEDKIAVVGHASGAILGLLLAEQDIGVRAYVTFSPCAALWNERVDLQKAFVNSIREAKAPIFLIQAQNDISLEPSQLLGTELARRGDVSFSKVYPPFGTTHEQGNNFAVNGFTVWGDDVIKFLDRALN